MFAAVLYSNGEMLLGFGDSPGALQFVWKCSISTGGRDLSPGIYENGSCIHSSQKKR
jgi:hypothetical protein